MSIAREVPGDVVVARATELGARGVVVMAVADDPDAEGDAGGGAGVGDGVPVLAWQDDARVGRPLDHVALSCGQG